LIRVVLLGVPAMASLLANVAIVQAAEECRLSPGTAAPPGSKWLYRINRADHRHCWFLSSKAGGPHSQLARRHRHLAGEEEAARQDQQGDSDQQAASAPISKNDVAETVEPPTAPQVAPLSVEPSSENLGPARTYREAECRSRPTIHSPRCISSLLLPCSIPTYPKHLTFSHSQ
jgi:hypothetical protein